MLRNTAFAPARTWAATNNPSEDLFRLRKATLYADIIEAGGLAGAVDQFTEGQWAALAIVAQTKPPSTETCAVIGRLLRQRQEWRELVARESGCPTLCKLDGPK
jgi:hypothetical protein